MKKINKDTIRAQMVEAARRYFGEVEGNEILPTASGAFTIPVVSADGEEGFATISVTMRDKDRDGNPYDGYAEAEAYKAEQADKARMKAEREAESARKQAEKEARKAKAEPVAEPETEPEA